MTCWLMAAAAAVGSLGLAPQARPGSGPDIVVSVREAGTEAAIAGSRVELLRFPEEVLQTGFTDSSGTLTFFAVSPQAYVIRAIKKGYGSAEVSVEIRFGESLQKIDLSLPRVPAGQVAGTPATVSKRTLSIPPRAANEFRKGFLWLNEKRNPHRSIDCLRKAIDLFPGYYEAHFLMGAAYLQLKSYSEAQTALQTAILLNPAFLSAYRPLAVCLMAQRKYEEAERSLLEGMKLDPQGWEWPFELARCHANQGQWEKALGFGKMAHDRPKAGPTVHLLMADLFSNNGKPREALQELEEFARLDPQSPYMPRVRQAMDRLRQHD